jgi:DNA-binding response OmpR family regulator
MKILIVEDEVKLADALARGLALKGYAADVVYDGESAFNRLTTRSGDYDIVILDLMLPKMDGAEVCLALRERGIAIPILVLTAKQTVENKVSLLTIGADDYLVKPFSFDELVARLRAVLRRPAELRSETLRVGSISIDTAKHEVKVGGHTLELTRKEYAILECLAGRADEVVSREDLLAKLWDYNFDPFSNVLDVHVKNIRKKLHEANVEDVLETVRGVGYRLCV